MKVLLSGYYGFDNAGDDAVLFAIVQALRETMPDVDITVLSNQPEKTAAQLQVKAVNRWGKLDLLKAIKQCDVLIRLRRQSVAGCYQQKRYLILSGDYLDGAEDAQKGAGVCPGDWPGAGWA